MIDVTQASVVLIGLSMLAGILVFLGLLVFFGLFVQREFPPTVAREEEEPTVDRTALARRSAAYRQGFLVLVGLAVLTIAEYLVAVYLHSAVIILITNLFKAGLIVQYYMHVSRLWSEEGH
jgi:hypothetical protein